MTWFLMVKESHILHSLADQLHPNTRMPQKCLLQSHHHCCQDSYHLQTVVVAEQSMREALVVVDIVVATQLEHLAEERSSRRLDSEDFLTHKMPNLAEFKSNCKNFCG